MVAHSTDARDGRFIEQIGTYKPLLDPSEVKVDKERALHWLNVGAQASETVERLLKREGVWEEFEKPRPPKKPKRKPVKARVKKEKKPRIRKRKAEPEVEPAAEAAPEAAATEETEAKND